MSHAAIDKFMNSLGEENEERIYIYEAVRNLQHKRQRSQKGEQERLCQSLE